jgi:hypothetical protein
VIGCPGEAYHRHRYDGCCYDDVLPGFRQLGGIRGTPRTSLRTAPRERRQCVVRSTRRRSAMFCAPTASVAVAELGLSRHLGIMVAGPGQVQDQTGRPFGERAKVGRLGTQNVQISRGVPGCSGMG